MSKRNNFYGSKTSYTARTLAFLAATGITDTTIANALNTMDLALIANGLDTKMKALYPFVGGTATTHKFNFMNPADTDASYRIVWAGGITHSSTGVLFNGSTGFGDTKLNASATLNANSAHQSIYSRTNSAGSYIDIGFFSGGSAEFEIITKFSDGNIYADCFNYTTNRIGGANANSQKFYVNNRSSSNVQNIWRDGVKLATGINASAGFSGVGVIYIGTANGLGFYTNREIAFASIGDGLSDTDNTNYNTLVVNFQTALSRNV